MKNFKVTSFCAPPTAYRYFVKKGMQKYDLSSLEYLTTAGEALNPIVAEAVYQQTGLHPMEGYGQSETTLLIANLNGTHGKTGSIGKPSPMYNIKLVDSNGDEVKQGETGEIVVVPPKDRKQYGIFTGYIGDEQMYQYAWRNGMYHTNDTAYMDEDGYFWYGRQSR